MTADERARCAVIAGLLDGAASVAAFGLLLTASSLVRLLLVRDLSWPSVACAAALLPGLAERYLWLRLRLDRRLFDALGQGTIESLGALDDALADLGLRPTTPGPTRPLAARLAGTRRLLRRHAAVVGAQAVLLIPALVSGAGT